MQAPGTLFAAVTLLLAPLLLDAPYNVDTGNAIQQWVSQFSSVTTQILTAVNTSLNDLLKVMWITLVSLGVLLYITRVHRRLGKDFIMGGVAMMILIQFVFPLVTKT